MNKSPAERNNGPNLDISTVRNNDANKKVDTSAEMRIGEKFPAERNNGLNPDIPNMGNNNANKRANTPTRMKLVAKSPKLPTEIPTLLQNQP